MRVPTIHIYKRSNGAYSVRWREHGKQREKRGFATKREANEYRRILESELRKSKTRSADVTLDDIIGVWYETHVPRLSKSSQSTARTTIRTIIRTLNVYLPIDTYNRLLLQEWIDSLPKSDKAKHRMLSDVSSIFALAVRDGIIEQNPVKHIAKPVVQRAPIVIPSSSVFEAFERTAIDDQQLAMLYVAALGGLRQGELFGLEWRHVQDGALIVEQVMDHDVQIRKTTKTNLSRRVPIPQKVVDALQVHKQSATTELIFTSPNGQGIHATNWRRRVFVKWRDRAVAIDIPSEPP